MEHGANRVASTPRLDCNGLWKTEDRFPLFQHARLEYLSCAYAHRKEHGRSDTQLDIGYFFYNGPYVDDIAKVLDPGQKTIAHIPNVNSRESTQRGKTTEVSEIMDALGTWEGKDSVTGFDKVKRPDGRMLKIADLVDDGLAQCGGC
jgi:hypothetical protein